MGRESLLLTNDRDRWTAWIDYLIHFTNTGPVLLDQPDQPWTMTNQTNRVGFEA